jgi:hypothetical protein
MLKAGQRFFAPGWVVAAPDCYDTPEYMQPERQKI